MMTEQRQRRRFTPEEKVAIVLEGLRGDMEVSAVCRRHGVTTGQYYQWRDKLKRGAKDAFSQRGRRQENGRVAELEAQVAQKDAIIAEITGEILKVKKGLWP